MRPPMTVMRSANRPVATMKASRGSTPSSPATLKWSARFVTVSALKGTTKMTLRHFLWAISGGSRSSITAGRKAASMIVTSSSGR